MILWALPQKASTPSSKSKTNSKLTPILYFLILLFGMMFFIDIKKIQSNQTNNNKVKIQKKENQIIEKEENETKNKNELKTENVAPKSKNKNAKQYTLYPVIKISDGDTIKILKDNKIETIRIIGINTPEIGKRLECFGNEARNKALELLTNKKIRIITDRTQSKRDKYNRLLAYVLINGKTDFGEQMIKEGFAYEYTYNTPYKNQQKYKIAQKYAQKFQKGLWAKNTCKTQKAQQINKNDIQISDKIFKDTNGKCLIKGNISARTKDKIYHLPHQQAYKRTKINTQKGEKWFCTEQEALKAGWRKSRQ